MKLPKRLCRDMAFMASLSKEYQQFESIAPINTNGKLEKYFNVCLNQLEHKTTPKGIINVGLRDCRLKCGKIKSGKQNLYVWDVCQDLFGFYRVIEKGSNFKKRLSEAMINKKYIRIIEEHSMAQTDPNDIQLAPASIEGLKEVKIPVIIDRDKITQALLYGKYQIGERDIELFSRDEAQLKWLLENSTPEGILQQTFVQTATGRLYSKGKSMQNITKVARNIAVPQHRIFDLNSACFSFFYEVYRFITKRTLINVEHYIQNTKRVRLKVAEDISRRYREDNGMQPLPYFTEYTTEYAKVKEAFTAIGFGAKVTNNSKWLSATGNWEQPAINSKLGKLTPYFLDNLMVQNFLDELKLIKEQILINKDAFPLYPGVELTDDLTEAQTLAYIYQSQERHLLDAMYSATNGNCVSILHDGLMTPSDIDHQLIRSNMEDKVKQSLVTETHIRVTQELNHAYVSNPNRGLNKEQQHRVHIENDEYQARQYSGNYSDSINFTTPTEMNRMIEGLLK